MRILFVSHYALPHLGGMEVAIDAVAAELQRRGHEVAYVASDAVRPDDPASVHDTPYRLIRVPAVNTLESRTGAPWPVFGPSLVSVLRREVARADVVHAHGFLYMSSLVALLAARALGGRSPLRVLTEHVGHVDYESRLLDEAERVAIGTLGRLCARSAEALVYFNDGVAERLRELAPRARVERIENGVDHTRFRPAEPGERARLRSTLGWDERPRVLFVGRLVAKKGVEAALDAATAADGAFELVLVGPGALRRDVPNTVALGALPPGRMPELYRAADAFLLPSRGEGFPLSVQEAMASGLPVVLADDPAYPSHLDGAGDGALLVPPQGATLAEALRSVLDSPEAGIRAVEHARRRFSWSTATDAHEGLYAELASARASSLG